MKKILAQSLNIGNSGEGGGSIQGNFNFASIGEIINKLLPLIVAAAGIGLLLMLISAGFSFLTSAGDPKKLEAGKQKLTYSLIGFFLIMVSYILVQIIGFVLGFEEIEQIFK